MDRKQIDTIALIHPNIDTSKAKKALQKQHSIAESLYEDSFVLGGQYYVRAGEMPSPDSSMPQYHDEQDGPLSLAPISEEKPDPEKDNIHVFIQSGEVKGRTESRYQTQNSVISLSSKQTIV